MRRNHSCILHRAMIKENLNHNRYRRDKSNIIVIHCLKDLFKITNATFLSLWPTKCENEKFKLNLGTGRYTLFGWQSTSPSNLLHSNASYVKHKKCILHILCFTVMRKTPLISPILSLILNTANREKWFKENKGPREDWTGLEKVDNYFENFLAEIK